MNAYEPIRSPSRYPAKSTLNVVVFAALVAAVYSAVSSQTETQRTEPTNRVEINAATIRSGAAMPAPSSTASEGNVLDLTYPQYLN